MNLDHPVASSLLPVVLLIGIGFVAGRMKLIRGEAVRDLSNLVFLVLVQALLFRTMATAHLERLDLTSVALYYIVAGAMFFALLFMRGLNSRSAVLALASIFSNTLMIGLPLKVMVVAAALPVGANVFLFSQRYHKEEDLVTASVAVSTVMAVGTISVVMGLLAFV